MLVFLVTILFSESAVAFDPKTVNLQLETSVLLDPGEFFNKNPNIIRSAKDVIDSVQKMLLPRTAEKRNIERTVSTDFDDGQEAKLLTKFMLDLSTELMNYKEDTLKDIAKILYDEANDYYRRGPRNPILLDDKIKIYVMKKLKDLKDTEPTDLKLITRRFASNPQREKLYESVDSLNKFFNNKDTSTFDKLIRKLHLSSRLGDKTKISETIRETLEFLIIDRYNKMNDIEKESFSYEIHKLVDGELESSTNIFDILKKIVDNALRQYITSIFDNNNSLPKAKPIEGEGVLEDKHKRYRDDVEKPSSKNEVRDNEEKMQRKNVYTKKTYAEFYK